MTPAPAGVEDFAPCRGHEHPFIPAGAESDCEHTVRAVDSYFAVGNDCGERIELRPARADRELPDAPPRVHMADRVLRRKPFVQVVMPRNHDVHIPGVENIPELLHLILTAVQAGAVPGMMEIRERAALVMRGEVGGQPQSLRGIAHARTTVLG